jgi:hypothetical protein
MAGGRPRLAIERSKVHIGGVDYEYIFYQNSWSVKYSPGPGIKSQGACRLKNGDVADEATIAMRIRESLGRVAASAPASAPAAATNLSPLHVRDSAENILIFE